MISHFENPRFNHNPEPTISPDRKIGRNSDQLKDYSEIQYCKDEFYVESSLIVVSFRSLT